MNLEFQGHGGKSHGHGRKTAVARRFVLLSDNLIGAVLIPGKSSEWVSLFTTKVDWLIDWAEV